MKPNISNASEIDKHFKNYELIEKLGNVGSGHKLIELEKRISKIEELIDQHTESVAKRREIEARLSILSETIHQATTNLKSATAVAGWAEMRKKMIKGEQTNDSL